MIEEIKKRLGAGEVVELECVDREGFLKDIRRRGSNEKILDQAHLQVDYIDYDGGIRLGGNIGDIYCNVIVSEEFKYFRIKESSATFDGLIDVAVQAYKDGVLSKVELRDDEINLTKLGVISSNRGHSVFQDAINDIKSLYTETFVIESEEDMRKMRIESKGVLPNGLEFKVTDTAVKMFDGENDLAITVNFNGMEHNELLYLSPLKGATVTQKRDK